MKDKKECLNSLQFDFIDKILMNRVLKGMEKVIRNFVVYCQDFEMFVVLVNNKKET